MKRDATGKFTSNWGLEAKRRVNLTLTNTAWQWLEQEAEKHGISRSEVIERAARSFALPEGQLALVDGNQPKRERLRGYNSFLLTRETDREGNCSDVNSNGAADHHPA